MEDYPIDDARIHLNASKGRDYRERVRLRFRVLISFLQDNDLCERTILPADAEVDEDVRIMRSDLTDEGFAVVKDAYDKWLRAIDRGKSIEDITLLEKALARSRR